MAHLAATIARAAGQPEAAAAPNPPLAAGDPP